MVLSPTAFLQEPKYKSATLNLRACLLNCYYSYFCFQFTQHLWNRTKDNTVGLIETGLREKGVGPASKRRGPFRIQASRQIQASNAQKPPASNTAGRISLGCGLGAEVFVIKPVEAVVDRNIHMKAASWAVFKKLLCFVRQMRSFSA